MSNPPRRKRHNGGSTPPHSPDRTPATATGFRLFDLHVEPKTPLKWPSVSVCIITKNESANLGSCLSTLLDLPSQIIVVDTGSSDDTVQVARALGAQVHHFAWVDDFSAARNESLRMARGDWVFWMDADDRLEPRAVAQLKQAAARAEADAYICRVTSKHADGSRNGVEHLRLFRNGLGLTFSGAIHESLVPSAVELGLRLGRTDIDIDHVGYESPEVLRKKSERNLRVIERQIVMSPEDMELLFYRGQARINIEDLTGAEQDMRAYLDGTKTSAVFDSKRFGAYSIVVQVLSRRGRLKEIEPVLRGALAEFLGHPNFLGMLGRLHLVHGNSVQALTELTAARDALSSTHLGYCPPLAAMEASMAECRQMVGVAARVDPVRGHSEVTPTPARPSLSLCMIVKNEERHIARCLESARGLVDEMVVVDTGSEDRTPEIVRSYGATLYTMPWRDDFSQARNFALEHARGDWVLFLDADEELETGSRTRLRDTIARSRAEGLTVTVRSLSAPDDIVRYEDGLLTRLFTNRREYRYEQPIHEQIRPSIERSGGKVADSDLVILHHGYAQPLAQGQDPRAGRNLRLLQKALAATPDDPYLHYQLGGTYKAAGNRIEALRSFQQALELNQGTLGSATLAKLYMKLAQLALASDDYGKVAEFARRSLGHNPENSLSIYLLALAHMFQGQVEQAYPHFLRLRRSPDTGLAITDELDAVIQYCRELMGSKAGY